MKKSKKWNFKNIWWKNKSLQSYNSLVYFYISGVQIKDINNNRSSSHTKWVKHMYSKFKFVVKIYMS